jgi:branched-chain amino acid transport system permease protein
MTEITTAGPTMVSSPASATRPARLSPDLMVALGLTLAAAIGGVVLIRTGEIFFADMLIRITILALAAQSLNLLIGFAGLVSFGHAVYLGLGGYAVGILASHEVLSGPLQLAVALAVSALFAFLTGLIALRTRGVHFIMITMALSQMVYFVLVGLRPYGGDDGLTINERSVFPAPFDIESRLTLHLVSVVVLGLVIVLLARLRSSRFGLVLAAAKANESRVAASGFDPYRYRLAAYVIAGTIAGLAGFLLGNFTNFVTPEMMGWSRSGELMFMLILGGVGTLTGPIIGTAAYLVIEEVLSKWTIYWHLPFGLILIGVVLFSRGGLVGLVERMLRR